MDSRIGPRKRASRQQNATPLIQLIRRQASLKTDPTDDEHGQQHLAAPLQGWGTSHTHQSRSKPRVYRLAFQREHTEHAFMGAAKRFLADKTFESFNAQGKLPACEGSLGPQTTRTQAF